MTRKLLRGVWWDLCNLTINSEATAKYLNDDLEKGISRPRPWRPQIRSRHDQIFIYPFSSFPPLNAIKKIAHTPAARTRSTTRVCILKSSVLFQHGLMASQSIGPPRSALLLPFTADRVATEQLLLIKKKDASTEAASLELLELVRQLIKCDFCMLVQMTADCQFHCGSLRIGLPLRVPDPISRRPDHIGVNPRQMQ